MIKNKSVFIVWRNFQRRPEVLAPRLGTQLVYFRCSWSEHSFFHKVLSYIVNALSTAFFLLKNRPSVVFIQLAPTPLLYIAWIYALIFKSQIVSDCHNSMIQGEWINWPFARIFLSKTIVLVHNKFILAEATKKLNFEPLVLRDGFETINAEYSLEILDKFGLQPGSYVIMPWGLASDEPLLEALSAARQMPEKRFVITWHLERIPSAVRANMPDNVVLTGYLDNSDFTAIFANAGVALVLTKREGTQLSGMAEAISFKVPAVISNLQTTKGLYGNAACYVDNEAFSIARGIKEAFQRCDELKANMVLLQEQTEVEIERQLQILREKINENISSINAR